MMFVLEVPAFDSETRPRVNRSMNHLVKGYRNSMVEKREQNRYRLAVFYCCLILVGVRNLFLHLCINVEGKEQKSNYGEFLHERGTAGAE